MKNVKRVFAGFMALVLLVSTVTITAFAADSMGMVVTTDGESITALKGGDTVTVRLTLPQMDALAGVNVHLDFDKTLLDFQEKTEYDEDEDADVKVINTKLAANWGPTITDKAIANNNGRVQFNAAGIKNRTIAADFNLLTVEFKVREGVTGSAEFKVSRLEISYLDGTNPVSITDISEPTPQTITVTGGVTPPAHTCTLTKIDAKAATCTEDGNIEYYQCSDPTCGKLYKDAAGTQEITNKDDVVIKAGHKYGELIAEVSATCGENGTKAHYECSVCHKNFDTDYAELTDLVIPATGKHVWELVIKEVEGATTHTKKCKVCGATEEETHDKWPGDYPTEWTYDDDYHWHEFACGTIMDKAEHKWGDWYTSYQPADCTRDGWKTYTCTVCQETKTEVLPATDHT